MKKKIELPDIKGHEMIVQKRTIQIARAIAKRTNIQTPDEKEIKETVKGKKYIELDLTQRQIDELPIGLRKVLK